MTKKAVLALDAGTTSVRAILFDHAGAILAVAGKEFPQIYPKPGLGGAQRPGHLEQPADRGEGSACPGRPDRRGCRRDRRDQPAGDLRCSGIGRPANRS